MEKRNTVRVPFHVRSVVKYDENVLEGEVVNLSTGGMLFNTADEIPVDAVVTMSVILYGSSSELALNIAGRVVRKSGQGIAIRFTELDLDSFIHLRNIVSRNAFEEETMMKEFNELKSEGSTPE